MKKTRPPIVVVLGHVDHGKTTLLDAIRKTNIAGREAGGITQGIGASKVVTEAGQLTFIDTPGHAAFSRMRLCGAKVADIALLVVASDDGVKPQTIEALNYILEVKIPYIVVLTKTDLPSANVEKAKKELEERGVLFEGRGGDVPVMEVSVKRNQGVEDLVEMIHLFSQFIEIKGDGGGELKGYVIETRKDKKGMVVLVVVTDGKLGVGDELNAAGIRAKVRGIFGEGGVGLKELGPGDAGLVMGFSEFPQAGAGIEKATAGKVSDGGVKVRERAGVQKGEVVGDRLAIVVKASSSGSLEAVISCIPEGVVVISSGVGDVAESDIFVAKSAEAMVFAFESAAQTSVLKLAESERVRVERFEVIYDLVKRLEELVEGKREKVSGKAEVIKKFPFDGKSVAGCRVIEGKIKMGGELVLRRGGKEMGKVKIVSLKRERQNIESALAGEECGILFKPQLDFEEGDVLVSVAS